MQPREELCGQRAYAVRVARHADDARHDDERVIDLDRLAQPVAPPVPGAQWDELHRRWERWDELAGSWMIVGDGASVPRPDVEAVPAFLARELHHADDIDAVVDHIIDVDRLAAPSQPVPGAQWNEVVGRWERWDEAAGAWVEARADAPSV